MLTSLVGVVEMSHSRAVRLSNDSVLQDPADPGQDYGRADENGTVGSPQPGQGGVRYVGPEGDQSIDGVLLGVAWTDTAINFSFPDSPSAYDAGYSEAGQNFRSVSAAQHAAADCVLTGSSQLAGYRTMQLGSVSSFTNKTFTDVGTGSAAIMLASSSAPPTSYAYYPGTATKSGDVWFGQAYDNNSFADLRAPAPGDYAYMTIIHELGHSLGLKHGNEAGGVANETLPAATDDLEYSVMTYASYVGSTAGYDTCALDSNPQTYMMDDIAALQYLYGANFNVVGPTTYSWDPDTGETLVNGVGQGQPGNVNDALANRDKVFLTLWNGDGKDATYDLSAYDNGVRINLNPGQYSITSSAQLADLGPGVTAQGNVYNALQYQGDTRSLIANAVGGSGDDVIVGNAADNVLEGGLGSNAIDGGGGFNTALYAVARSQAVISLASDGTIDVGFQGGEDSLTNIQALHFSNETIATASLPWINYTFTAAGTSGTVAMDDPAADSPGGIQSQYIYSGSDSLVLSTQAPTAFIRTGSGDDTIQVSGGQNVLDGGSGSNVLIGGTGAGADSFYDDASGPSTVSDTIQNFHAGDAATLWGFDPQVSSFYWDGSACTADATLRVNIAGGSGRTGNGVDASVTFTGLSGNQAQGLQIATGTQTGGNYLYLYNPGV